MADTYELNSLKIAELKEQLQERGLPITGMKAALVERLKNAGVTSVTLSRNKQGQTNNHNTQVQEAGDNVGISQHDQVHSQDNDSSIPESTAQEEFQASAEEPTEVIGDEDFQEEVPEYEGEFENVDEVGDTEYMDDQQEDGYEGTGQYVEDSNTAVQEEFDAGTNEGDGMETASAPEHTEEPQLEENGIHEDIAEVEGGDDKENAIPASQRTETLEEMGSAAVTDQPPTPTSVPVVAPFTSEDVIQLGEGTDRLKDDDISLVVNVDESQNEFDIPETPLSKSGEVSDAGDVDSKKDSGNGDSKSSGKPDINKDESAKDGAEQSSSPSKAPVKKDDKAKPNTSNRSLWISGLAKTTRATDLKTLFSKYGKVAGAKVVTNAKSPGARCYGFVTMNTADEASKCIQYLHRTELHGRMISVERAKPVVKKPEAKPEEVKKEEEKKKETTSPKDGKKEAVQSRTDRHRPTTGGRDRPASYDRSRRGPERHGADQRDQRAAGDKNENRDRPTHRSRGNSRADSKHEPAGKDEQKKPEEGEAARKAGRPDEKELLSLDKIREARDRERLRRQERRKEMEQREREREMRMLLERQRLEGARLEKERERLRLERERLERERLEAEREKLKLERERRDRERQELEDRRLETVRYESRTQKRTYDGRGEDYWGEPKRAYDGGRGERRVGGSSGGDRREVVRRDMGGDRDDRNWEDRPRYETERRSGGGGAPRTEQRRSPRQPSPVRRSSDHHHNPSGGSGRHETYRGGRNEHQPRERPADPRSGGGRDSWQGSSSDNKDTRGYTRGGQAPRDAPSGGGSSQWAVPERRGGSSSHVLVQPQSSDSRQWQTNVSLAPARSSVLTAPLLQSAPNPGFLASAANIMLGVGLARGNEQRYDAYKGMAGNLRRY